MLPRSIGRTVVNLCLIVFITHVSVNAQTDPSEIEKYKKDNQEMSRLIRKGDLKEAKKMAAELCSVAEKVFGPGDRETGIAYKNAGEISRGKEDYSDAYEYLSRAIDIFQKGDKNGSNADMIAKSASSLGFVLAKQGKEDQAGEMYKLAIAKAVVAFGEDSAELIQIRREYVLFKVLIKDYEGADKQFAELYTATAKVFPDQEDLLTRIDDDYICTVGLNTSFGLGSDDSEFFAAKKAIRSKDIADEGKTVETGVVNGKALSLARPEMNPGMASRLTGRAEVVVRIVIGKEGNVNRAWAICGPGFLHGSSVDAARRSRFRPTLLNGEPVEVSGVIVYNYRR